MRDLLAYLETEQPRVNAVLARETGRLHPLVQPAVKHVLGAGGKRLRPLLTLLMARAAGRANDPEDPRAYPLACAMEFLHSATLLHDDILDGADLRRGLPAAHLIFGRTQTILAGDALLALGNRLVAEHGDPDLVRCVSEAIMRTAEGEIAEIAHTRDPNMTQALYLEIVTGKTAYLIQAACRCGAVLGGGSPRQVEAAADYGLHLGVAFQLVDDALDYSANRAVTGKPVAADLLEGKLTLPMLLHLEKLPAEERAIFFGKFMHNELTEDYLLTVAAEVKRLGYAERTRAIAAARLDAAKDALAEFPASPERDLLGQALTYVLTRDR